MYYVDRRPSTAALQPRSPEVRNPCPALIERLEDRLLMSVTGTASSNAASIVAMMTSWTQSGSQDGVIAQGLYTSHDHQEVTDAEGLHVSDSLAEPYTLGTDPGFLSGIGLMAKSNNNTYVINGGAAPTMAMSSAFIDYVVSVRQIAPLPAGFPTDIFYIPVKSSFWLHTQLSGVAGAVFVSGTADAYAEVCMSDGSQYAKDEVELDWSADQSAAGTVTHEKTAQFSNTIAYSPTTHGTDYVSVHFTAAGSSQVAGISTPSLSLESSASANVTDFAFDQAAFNAAQGSQAFILSDYFELVYGWDPSVPVPKKGKTGNTFQVTCTKPDLVDNSDTGIMNSDNLTGDTTPTFEGTVFSGTKPLKSGQVVLYVNGVEAAQGAVTNGQYRVTILTPLGDGGYSITASAGTSAYTMGPRSEALNIVIDADLPRGDTLTAVIGDGVAKSLKYTDGDGSVATVKLTAGTATFSFAGDGIDSDLSSSNVLTVSGIDLRVTDLSLTGTTAKSALTFAVSKPSGSDGHVELGAMECDGPLKTFGGKGVNLLGDMTVAGAVGSLTLNDVTGAQHAISLGGTSADKPTTLVFNRVADTTLSVGAPLAAVTAAEWDDSGGPADTITAPSIGKLTSKGDFAAGMTLSGAAVPQGKTALGSTKITGLISGGTWTVHGSSADISALGVDASWQGLFDGSVKSLSTKSTMSGTLTALSAGSINITGNMDGATIRLTQPVAGDPKLTALGTLSVGGTMNDSTIDAAGDIKSVTLGRMIGSSIFAGVDTGRNALGTLPNEVADFDAQATIATFTIKGIRLQRVSFQDSCVAAAKLGAVTVMDVPSDSSALGGVAADNLLRKYTRKITGGAALNFSGPLAGPLALDSVDGYVMRLV